MWGRTNRRGPSQQRGVLETDSSLSEPQDAEPEPAGFIITMEENPPRDPQRPHNSGEESNRALLPLPPPPGNQQTHRVTNFYIDNILRPDFGLKEKDGTPVRDGFGFGLTKGRDQLTESKAPKTSKRGGPGAEKGPNPESKSRRPELTPEKVREGPEERSPEAGAAPGSAPPLWPAWVYCTRYSDRPSSGG
uniref:Engrailed homeobox 2 n=1 Tax=Nothobranchius furzeri TaxID=105023 RepID=A0A8C6LMA9_NOTFU